MVTLDTAAGGKGRNRRPFGVGEGDEEVETVSMENRMVAWGGVGSGNAGGLCMLA